MTEHIGRRHAASIVESLEVQATAINQTRIIDMIVRFSLVFTLMNAKKYRYVHILKYILKTYLHQQLTIMTSPAEDLPSFTPGKNREL
jgi:hypothetical protein